MVTEQPEPEQVFGLAPTMLSPYVTPSSGLNAEPHQWGTVRVVGRTDAPPSTAVRAFSSPSPITCGSMLPPEAAADEATMATIAAAKAMRRPSLRYRIWIFPLPRTGQSPPLQPSRRGIVAWIGPGARRLRLRRRRGRRACPRAAGTPPPRAGVRARA